MNIRLGRLSRFISSPNFGWCYRCRTTWLYVNEHATSYGDGSSACFPLCEKCWKELTPETRIPCYEQLFRDWECSQPMEPGRTDQIRAAVLAGK